MLWWNSSAPSLLLGVLRGGWIYSLWVVIGCGHRYQLAFVQRIRLWLYRCLLDWQVILAASAAVLLWSVKPDDAFLAHLTSALCCNFAVCTRQARAGANRSTDQLLPAAAVAAHLGRSKSTTPSPPVLPCCGAAVLRCCGATAV